jgi:hypothetical protein
MKEGVMPKVKMSTVVVVVAIALCLTMVGSAAAGQKQRGRNTFYTTKWHQFEVGDSEGHVVALYESIGIHTNVTGKSFGDGWPIRLVGFSEFNTKTGTGHCFGYDEFTDNEGDKVFQRWEGKLGADGKWAGTVTFIGGTGKWTGIKGKGTWKYHALPPSQGYGDNEWDIEFP